MEYIEIDDFERFQKETQVKTMKYKHRNKTELEKQEIAERIFKSEIMNKEFDLELIAKHYIPKYNQVLNVFKELFYLNEEQPQSDSLFQSQMQVKYVADSLYEGETVDSVLRKVLANLDYLIEEQESIESQKNTIVNQAKQQLELPINKGFGKTEEDETREFEKRYKNGDFALPLEQMPFIEGENEDEIKKRIEEIRQNKQGDD